MIESQFIKVCGLLLVFLIGSTLVNAQNFNDDYAETEGNLVSIANAPIEIVPNQVNVLTARRTNYSANFKCPVRNHMFMFLEAVAPAPYTLEWEVASPKAGDYDVTTLISALDATIELRCNGKILKANKTELGWERLNLGKVKMKKGVNTIQMFVNSDESLLISSLELTQSKVKRNIMKEALKVRQNPEWFRDAGYGVMFQWMNRATPERGDSIKNWEQKVNDFDVDAFANMIEETGAAYVIWSVTWGQQYISAPLKSLDKLIQGRTTKRDLLGDIADVLDERGIKLIFYYHYGYDCNHSIDSAWMEASGGYQADKTKLYQNVNNILIELGDRYKDKLHGWWFDGAQRYYDCHFDGTSGGILSAPFKAISQAVRAGNKLRIIAYNSWHLPKFTEYQDYYSGENFQEYNGLNEGIFSDGNYMGFMAHTCFRLDGVWAHISWNKTIPSPKYSLEQLTGMIQYAQENRYPLSLNMEMYEDGSVSPESLELLMKVKEIFKKSEIHE